MTKQETISYYEAMNVLKLIIIDTIDSSVDIMEKLKEATIDMASTALHIEVFHMDKGINTYSLIHVADNTFDLWNKKKPVLKAVTIEKIADYILSHFPKNATSPYDLYVAERLDKHRYLVKSFTTPEDFEIDDKNVSQEILNTRILGQYNMADGRTEYHPIQENNIQPLFAICEKIQNDNIRLFAKTALKIAPSYITTVMNETNADKCSASDNDEGGLLRHIVSACDIYMSIVDTTYANIKFSQHEKDMMLCAVLLCDILKYGWQEDYDENPQPHDDHPFKTAEIIKSIAGIISINEMYFISNCIASHGYPGETAHHDNNLTPDTEYKNIVQLSHLIAAKTNLDIVFDDMHYVFGNSKIKSVDAKSILTSKDKENLQNLMDFPIDKTILKSKKVSEKDTKENWQKIIDTGLITQEQMKYIQIANEITWN